MIESKLNIPVQKVAKSKLETIDFDSIPFGSTYSDHMFTVDYVDGEWKNYQVVPYDYIKLSPACTVLHYGQSIFEGLKAYRNSTNEDEILLFRADKNFERLNLSAERMCIPQIPEDIFFEGLSKLIETDQDWVPRDPESSLYIRPVVFGTDEFIGVKASESYKLLIFVGPTGAYYPKPVRVKIETEYTRAASGGTGAAKAAGNYAATLYPAYKGKDEGFDQLIWTDAREHKYIEEAGTMNVMFVIDGKIITPPAGDTILNGVTRDSALTIARSLGYEVEERPVAVDEVITAIKEGRLSEAFGTGTAATIATIREINHEGVDYTLPSVDNRPIASAILQTLSDLRRGRAEDTRGWVKKAF